LPTDATLPAYLKLSGTVSVSAGVVTLTGARLSIGAYASTATTATTTPGGIFNIVGKTCTMILTAGSTGTGSGSFQIFVDNNTTSSSASIHGSASKVYTALATSIAKGDNTISWTLTDSTWPSGTGSFITLRTESSTTVTIDAISLSCN
jgi:pectate lyase